MTEKNKTQNNISQPETENEIVDPNELIALRRQKLAAWREQGQAFPTHFKRDALAAELLAKYGEQVEFENQPINVKVAGRIVTRRMMGKASFTHIQDMTGKLQLYVRQDDVTDTVYEEFKQWDLGDIVGAEGLLFKTKTGELSVKVKKIILLTKSLRPLPDKFHGLHDQETRYRQRYLDLISNEETRNTFLMRSKITETLRKFLSDRQFLEVETPMMQVLAGGAAAKPFVTHHEALDMPLYLRIAPELYLKRLVVGGFEKVFEINRNFRNEGLSTQHNPEFTMVEFYQAYADYEDLMDLTENLFKELAQAVFASYAFEYQGLQLDFSNPFARISMKQSILQHNPDLQVQDLESMETLKAIAKKLEIQMQPNYGMGKLQVEIFEKTVEDKLLQPTFITEYPAETSPLARRNDKNPEITDRFELFIAGREIANGFSELNDPEDQAERFKLQVQEKAAGDQEAMPYDADYIVALEHGLPPTAGEGIGIDRLVMLFTNSASIRDVILFPHMRKQNL